MKKILILESTVAEGGAMVDRGDIIDVGDDCATLLAALGRATADPARVAAAERARDFMQRADAEAKEGS